MTGQKFRVAPPRADRTIQALRGLGYTTEAALADLIDNSISAKAGIVDVTFHWAADRSRITLLDDGSGMTDPELDRAMRLAEMDPLARRETSDLGRFGMGLKTASFSQAKRLTVASRKLGQLSCLRWDLDYLASDPEGAWHLLEGAHAGTEPLLDVLHAMPHGTLVIWEALDRVVTEGFAEADLLDLIDRVEKHLSMVFHRFLDGSGQRIRIRINGRDISAWDPFLTWNSATWRSPEVRIGPSDLGVAAQAFVLSNKDRLSDKQYLDGGGPDGWSSQQGFYIYRGRRLLVAGTWLSLGRGRAWSKDESHRLARIRLDIPNSSDADWKIDIKKSSAQAPVRFREPLTRLAEDTRSRARRVFLHRAQSNNGERRSDAIAPFWISADSASGRRYRVDRNHPAVAAVFEDAAGLAPRVEAMLRTLEETIPVQRIWLEATESGEQAKGGFAGESEEAVIEVLAVLYRNLVHRKGLTPEEARRQLLHTEPFDLHPRLVASLGSGPENS